MTSEPHLHESLSDALAIADDWYISELTSEKADISIEGKFKLSSFSRLDPESYNFLLTFLRCRGVLSSVEKELGLSYPTVRARLDALLKTLNLAPVGEEPAPFGKKELTDKQREVLSKLESGEISAEEAKKELKEAAS